MKNKQEKAQALSEALQNTDETMLRQAYDTDNAEKFRLLKGKTVMAMPEKDRPVTNFRRYATAAACLAFAVCLALVIGSFVRNFHSIIPGPADPTHSPLTSPNETDTTAKDPTVSSIPTEPTEPTVPKVTLPNGPYDPSTPPMALVSCGEQSMAPIFGGYDWNYILGEDNRNIKLDTENPLSNALADQIPWMHVASLVMPVQFQMVPDSIMVRCWEIGSQGDEHAYAEYQIASVRNNMIQLKSGSYIYEITGEWYFDTTGYGTVSYIFGVSSSATVAMPEMNMVISSGDGSIDDAVACLEEAWVYDDGSGNWVIYSGPGGYQTLIYTDWTADDVYLPQLALNGELLFTLSDGGEIENIRIYYRSNDSSFALKQTDVSFEDLTQLPSGQWYVIVSVTWQGRHIEAQNAYESHRYDYLFQLSITENDTEPGICGKDVTWSLNMNTGTLTISGTGPMYDIEHAPWYDYRHLIKKVVIEEGVTTIDGFSSLQQLKSVQIASTVTTIAEYTFSGCSALKQIQLPEGMSLIGSYAFQNCSNLETINIPKSVTAISWAMLSGCRSLKSISLHNGITAIENYAFNGCIALTEIVIPDSVSSIGGSAFDNCSNLRSVLLGSSVTAISNHMFGACTALTEIVLPESIVTIDSYAFSGCTNLQTIVIGRNVESISTDAFQGCEKLQGFQISEENVHIATDSIAIFNKEMTAVLLMAPGYSGVYKVPDGVTVIKTWSFADCALAGVIMPDSVTIIEEYAFNACGNMESALLSNSLQTIEMRAFASCKALKQIVIPASVESIEYDAFGRCTGLESVTFLGKMPEFGESVFRDVTGFLYYPPDDEEWDNASQLPAPDMEWLPSICQGGHTIQILPAKPATCTEDGLEEGKVCSVCGETILYQQVIPATGHDMNDWEYVGTSGNARSYRRSCANCNYIEEKSEELPTYPAADGKCGETLSWHFADGTLTISGSGEMEEYSNRNVPPWREFADGITKVILPYGLTNISHSAFVGFVNLSEIQIPETVTSIGMQAFSECTGLTAIVIPDSVQTISSMAFFSCNSLKTLTIGTGINSIDMYAFQKCSALEEIHFLGDMPSMSEAFFGLTTTIYYPADNETWDTSKVSTYETHITWVTVETP